MASWVPWGAVGTLLSAVLLVLPERRIFWLIGLLIQYALVAILTAYALGIQVAGVILIGGTVVTCILWLSVQQRPADEDRSADALVDLPAFRTAALLLVIALGWGTGRAEWIQVTGLLPSARIGATMLVVVGMMQVGLFDRTLRVGLGILTMISGFQVIYAVIEPSLAVIALLVLVQLGLSITIGFLLQRTDGPAASGQDIP